ncbi:MAG: hypothetical protein ACFHX7_03500 [Pseudomonadota bacterium]
MSSIFKKIVFIPAVAILAACDGGNTPRAPDVVPQAPAEVRGVTGSAVKGVISGGTITVTDSTGVTVDITSGSTTNADGSYSLVFGESAAALSGPIVVTIDGTGGTTVCDLDVEGTTNDCPRPDGTFAAFGETYPADGIVLRSMLRGFPTAAAANKVVNVNITPASELATSLALAAAGTGPLTSEDVNEAGQQVLGLIQTLTGIDMSGYNINDVPVFDVTATSTTTDALPDQSYAMMGFASAIIALVDPNDPAADSIAKVLAAIEADVDVDESANLVASGTQLGRLADSVSKGINTINTRLVARGITRPRIATAVETARNNQTIFANFGTTKVAVARPTDPNNPEPPKFEFTKAFLNKLGNIMVSVGATTGAQGFGGTTQGATEVFAAELDVATRLSDALISSAVQAAADALVMTEAELAAGASEVDDDATDGLTGTLAKSEDGNTVTLTNGVSVATDAQTGVTATVTIPTASRTSDTTFSIPAVTIAVTQTEGSATSTLMTFTGSINATFAPESGDIGMKSLTLTGSVVGAAAGTSYGVNVVLSGLAGVTSEQSSGGGVTGSYEATISFASTAADDLSVKFYGTIGAAMQSFMVTAGSNSIMGTAMQTGTTFTPVLTDGTVYLTLTIDTGEGPGRLTNGVLRRGNGAAAVLTGTVDRQGLVTFSDGSIQSLPASIL